ncbi:MAG: 6-hydroxymethylpterin diphosphokinase MptE-like protein [Campylobacterota bacterium]|nr:6-hydroxymethylpterin diphosphokinase MptE-like protein [Campylobacterota bacterium]
MNLQDKVIQRYSKNLKLLEMLDNELYSRVLGLDELISHNEYQPRYELEYIQEREEFDIFDTITQTYLYNRKPDQFIKEAVQNTNFDKINSVDLFYKNFYNSTVTIDAEQIPDDTDNLEMYLHNDIVEFTKVFQNITYDSKAIFSNIDKFMFVGTLLGTHIQSIDKKIDSKSYFITEANLEIFRLSLFCANYYELSTKKLIFSIMDDRIHFLYKFKIFYADNFGANHTIKYYCSNYNIEDYFERVLEGLGDVSPFAFTYPTALKQLLKKSFQNIKNGYKILDTKNYHGFLKNKPVLLLGAGPSLATNLQWIKKNKSKFFIVAIGATIKKLIHHDIVPDMIISADGQKLVENQFDDNIVQQIKDIPFVASLMTHQDVLDKFDFVYLYEVMISFKETSQPLAGYSVSEVAFLLSYIFGAKDIYILGIDLALDQATGDTHIDTHDYKKTFDISQQQQNDFLKTGSYSHKDTAITVKGNFKENVVTTTIFNNSIVAFNKIIHAIVSGDKDIKIYNLGEGAYLNNTIPLKLQDINIATKIRKDYNDTKTFLESISSSCITSSEKEYLQKSLELIDQIIEKSIKLKSTKVKKYKQFLGQRSDLLYTMIDQSKPYKQLYLYEILTNYIRIMEPYLSYHFNIGVPDETKVIKEVKKIWCEQVKRICTEYKDLVEDLLSLNIR